MFSEPTLYKYSGAGNDFVVSTQEAAVLEAAACSDITEAVRRLCSRTDGFKAADGRTGADGLMLLSPSQDCDFRMEYYNSDGSSGMMCGNGGRCIVAFADFVGLKPGGGRSHFLFEAADGLHTGEILLRDGARSIVRLGMIDAHDMREVLGGVFLNTGTRHFVLFVDDVEAVDVAAEGARLRHDPEFAPEGTNVNFVSLCPDGSLRIRTFEKGVEAETLACGTGITAAAIAYWHKFLSRSEGGSADILLHARIADLRVSFTATPATIARNVFLTGPAERV